ncbi:hypothetical protein [Paenibacillus eucommiae]|uniref:Thymidylate kinase n=1 Tax=Paenibacillus eucommiae TaxID=1355755 RepID=A0ABS4IXN6_9BACL|nr:hypothetical protein [Paenibacillus eucommiae]MBP1992328.1 hypothetical protein [Paenibacillus eucommiae]
MGAHLQSKLILVEGLPATGKSTNSGIIRSQLEQNGYKARWIHEVARPHPTLFFYEASLSEQQYANYLQRFPQVKPYLDQITIQRKYSFGIDLLELEWNYLDQIGLQGYEELKKYDVWNFSLEPYIDAALEKWEDFIRIQSQKSDEIILLDSSIWQFQIYSFLLANASFTQIHNFLQKIYALLAVLQPTFIYFYRDDVEHTINELEAQRGTGFLEGIWARDQHNPYYQEQRPPGAAGYKEFLRDYSSWAERLFELIPFKKKAVEITEGNWGLYTKDILTFLDLEYVQNPVDAVPDSLMNGTYVNRKLNQHIHISGNTLITPTGARKKLVPRSEKEFYISDIPVILQFADNQIRIKGEQICERWTTYGTVFERFNQGIDGLDESVLQDI